MKTSSKKAKGRRLQDWVHRIVCDTFGLTAGQVHKSIMGERGVDVRINDQLDVKLFPYAIEAKNQEKIKPIYDMWEQTKVNAEKEMLHPLLIIKMNRKRPLAVMDAEEFIRSQGQ